MERALLSLGFAVLLGGPAIALHTSWGGASWVLDLTAGIAAAALALLRHRDLLRTALAASALGVAAVGAAWRAGLPAEPGPAMVLALGVLVGSAVRRLPPRRAVTVAAAGLAVVAVSPLGAHSVSSFGLAPGTALSAAGWLVAVALGLLLRLRDERRRDEIDRVRRDERLALARELHDVVAHHITGIVLHAQAAQLTAADDRLARIERAGGDALAALRRVVGVLRDDGDGPPSPERLADLVERFGARGPAVRLTLPERDPTWSPELSSTVYRIVQESLTNVARHAPQASEVAVKVVDGDAAVTVEVADDGPPGRPQTPGYGLIGMRERVESLGGALDYGPGDGGWTVVATLPR